MVLAIISIPVISLHADVALNNPINISNDAADDSFDFQVSATGSNVYVVWVKDDLTDLSLLMKASTDSGSSFGSAVTLSAPPTGEFISLPKIVSSGSKMYAAWEEDDESFGDPQIFFTNTTNNGSTTFTKEDLSASTDSSFLPNIAVSGSNVYVVWEERESADAEIFFMNSTDDGATFDSGGPFDLSSDASNSRIPQINASGNNVHVVWYGDTGSSTSTISIRSSTNGASSFNTVKVLDNTLANGLASTLDIDVASSGSNVFVVWEDGNEIMFANSTDAGATFDSGGPFNLSNSGSGTASEHPRVSISGSNVYVTWEENTEIYLRTSTTLNTPVEYFKKIFFISIVIFYEYHINPHNY